MAFGSPFYTLRMLLGIINEGEDTLARDSKSTWPFNVNEAEYI